MSFFPLQGISCVSFEGERCHISLNAAGSEKQTENQALCSANEFSISYGLIVSSATEVSFSFSIHTLYKFLAHTSAHTIIPLKYTFFRVNPFSCDASFHNLSIQISGIV